MRERRQARRGGFRGHITDAWSSGFAFNQHIRPVPWPCQRAEALFQRQPTNASWGHGTARHSIQRDISQPPAGCKTSRPKLQRVVWLALRGMLANPLPASTARLCPHKRAVAARFASTASCSYGCESKDSPGRRFLTVTISSIHLHLRRRQSSANLGATRR